MEKNCHGSSKCQSVYRFQVLKIQARCAVWVAQYVIPEARGKGLDQKMFLDRCFSGGFSRKCFFVFFVLNPPGKLTYMIPHSESVCLSQ